MKTFRLLLFTSLYLVAFHSFSQNIDQDFELPIPVSAADIYAIKLQNDGKMLVGGRIELMDDHQVNDLIRLNQDGKLDETFSSSLDTELPVRKIELLSTGEIIVIGSSIMKLSSSGQLINKLDSIQGINTVNIQEDDKIIITAYRILNGTPTYSLYRLNSDLTIDDSFNQTNSFDGWILDATLQGDKIIVVGSFSEVNGIVKNDLARFEPDGSLDTSFDAGSGSGPDNVLGTVTVQQDGKILVGPCIGVFNGVLFNSGIIRLNADGSIDTEFKISDQNSCGTAKPVLQGSNIILAGYFHTEDNIHDRHLYRLDSSGEFDSNFTPIKLFNRNNQEIAVNNSGEIIINNSHLSGNEYGLSKLILDGQIDQTFKPKIGRYGEINTGDYFNGQLVVAGDFIEIGNVQTRNLAKILPDGTVDTSFTIDPSLTANQGINLQPTQISIVDNNTIFVALENQLVKLDGKGEADKHFTTQNITDLREFRLLENGKIVIASSNRIGMLNEDGSDDLSFKKYEMMIRGKANLSIQSNGIIFTSYHNQGSNLEMKVSRLLFDGSIDQTFNTGSGSGTNPYFSSIDVLENDAIIGAGFFNQYDDIQTKGLVKLSGSGEVDSLFLNNYNTTAPAYTHLYTSRRFREGFMVSTFNASNGDYTLGFLDGDGTFNTNYSLPDEIKAIDKSIFPILVDEDSIFLLSRFEVSGNDHPSFVLRMIFENKPEITGTTSTLSTTQNSPIAITLKDLLVTDKDNVFPKDFSLNIHEGEYYSVTDSLIIPDADFIGTLHVPITVSSDKHESDIYNLLIEVLPVAQIVDSINVTIQIDSSGINEQTCRIIFSERVKNFQSDMINISNGVVTGLLTEDSTTFIATVKPEFGGKVLIEIRNGLVFNEAGYTNLASNVLEIELEDQVTAVGETLASQAIRYYPNPVTNEIHIDLPASWIGGQFRMNDANGKLIKTQKITTNSTVFNVENLDIGVYILSVSKGKNHSSFKLYKR